MNEQGSMIPIVGVVLLCGLLMLGVAVELGRWAATMRTATAAADAGARAGSVVLDRTQLYSGNLALDPRSAESEAVRSALAYPAPVVVGAEAEASTSGLCVTVEAEFRAGIGKAFGLSDRHVTVVSCAEPR
ncbi:MAG: hypothetical protein HKN93_05060, partial [Acidimicrobiia bacterium]|nr:hypothetical protein [Acidimicrobiia bacterium]